MLHVSARKPHEHALHKNIHTPFYIVQYFYMKPDNNGLLGPKHVACLKNKIFLQVDGVINLTDIYRHDLMSRNKRCCIF